MADGTVPDFFNLPRFLPHLLQLHILDLWEEKIEIGAKTMVSFTFS